MPATSLVMISIWNAADFGISSTYVCSGMCRGSRLPPVRHICAGDAQYTPCKLAKDTLVLVFVIVFYLYLYL